MSRTGRWILAGLLAGLVIRLVVIGQTTALGTPIEDERQYVRLATSLVRGDGFAWGPGEPTSLRPPLYPALVAGIWRVTGEPSFQAVRIVQIVLGLATALAVYALGRRAFDARVGLAAAGVAWLDPTTIYLGVPILTETLFTLLLVLFVLSLVHLVQRPGVIAAVLCGLILGAGALTRSVLWPVPLLLCPLLLWLLRESWGRRLLLSALVLAGFAAVVGPWAARNTRLQGVVTIVDTMGGMNLRMGNYEHTPEDRMWDAVSLDGEKNWIYAFTQEPPESRPAPGAVSEGYKDKWAQRKAIEYMRAHPGTTMRRSIIKFTDFWGLERSFLAGVQQGIYGVPMALALPIAAVMLLTSAAIMLAGAAGVWLARPDWRLHVALLLPIVVITGVHSIVFGHARYHAPLVPLVAIYGAALLFSGPPRAWLRRTPAVYGAMATIALLVAGWIRHAIVVDGAHLRALWNQFT